MNHSRGDLKKEALWLLLWARGGRGGRCMEKSGEDEDKAESLS